MSKSFDRAYFARFYESAQTRVHGAEQVAHLARGVTELIAWLGGDLESVLDVGAGPGFWRDWFARHKPRVSYRSIDVSDYACARYGHERRDISRWRARETFDLVVCQGVLPYLSNSACASAIDNIGAMAQGFVYLEAPTERDLRENCDLSRTDASLFARTGEWYKKRLARH